MPLDAISNDIILNYYKGINMADRKLHELKASLQKIKEALEILNDPHVLEDLDNPLIMEHSELKDLAINNISLALPVFHPGGINTIYNEKYREEIMVNIYKKTEPWKISKKKNNHPNGTDLFEYSVPPTEIKSTKIDKSYKNLYISSGTYIGEIDKVTQKVGEDHSIYGEHSNHHSIFGIFNGIASKPIIVFYVDNTDFIETIQPLLKLKAEQLENETKRSKRDSLKLYLGNFLGCKSLKVIHIDDEWRKNNKIINSIARGLNEGFYNSLMMFLPDKELEITTVREIYYQNNLSEKINKNTIMYSFMRSNYESDVDLNSANLLDLTIAEIQNFSDFNADKTTDLTCACYNKNELVAIYEVPKKSWVPVIDKYKNNPEFSKEIKQNLFRLKLSMVEDTKLVWINEAWANRMFLSKKSNLPPFIDKIYKQIQERIPEEVRGFSM
jgi:hypothetical protein